MESLSDTSPEAAKVYLDLMRKATSAQRIQLALSLTQTAIGFSKRAIARANPGMSQRELDLKFIELHYGKPLAEAVRKHLEGR